MITALLDNINSMITELESLQYRFSNGCLQATLALSTEARKTSMARRTSEQPWQPNESSFLAILLTGSFSEAFMILLLSYRIGKAIIDSPIFISTGNTQIFMDLVVGIASCLLFSSFFILLMYELIAQVQQISCSRAYIPALHLIGRPLVA